MRLPRLGSLVLLLLARLAVSGGAANAQTAWELSYVPISHWSYQVFDRLSSLGLIPLDGIAARPITRREARRLAVEALSRARTADPDIVSLVENDLQRLAEEFSTGSSLEIQARGAAGNRATEFSPDPSAGVSSAAVGLASGDGWLLLGRVTGGNSPGDPPAGEIYTSFHLGSIFFQLGRTSSSWGPSLRSSPFLSDNAGTLPLFRLTAELPQARLTKIVAFLERPGGSSAGDIALFATRLDWMVTPQFRLGFNESVVTVWGGPLTLYNLLEPIPVLSAVIAGYEFHELLGQVRNTAVSIDFDWLLRPGVRFYGTGYVDDALDRLFERRARIGILGGVYLTDPFRTGRTNLRLEYSGITNGTYSYASGLEYAYQGRSLGHWLGPDGDDLYLELTHHLNPSTDVQFSYAYTRHGEGRIGQPSPPPEDWFLSGVVEYRHTFGLQLQRFYSPSFETRYRVEVASVTNRGNVAGANAWEWLLGLELMYRWPALSAEALSLEGGESAEPGPAQANPATPWRPPGRLAVRHWPSTMTSSGPLSGPAETAALTGLTYRANAGDLVASFAYEAGSEQAFWSVNLHYPLAQFQHGGVSVFAGWGALTRRGELGGTVRDLTLAGPRLGAEVFYQFAPGGMGTPLYFAGQLSSPLLRGIWAPSEGGAPFYYWTYDAGVGWQFRDGFRLEVGFRGAVAVWRDETPDKTILRWDGLYVSVILN